ncbi:hypothetical protein F444_10499 [Phytophthora nicotianae P1976]|uniref:Uncharacterized protein n=1 Tax=Phytophthora nicotianae P1976 TaxID=1317066 RepID=A0A081A3Y0_PHYNI|nr:hypothetical protein F444_10499 [Phytophthora nicotianae P1976]
MENLKKKNADNFKQVQFNSKGEGTRVAKAAVVQHDAVTVKILNSKPGVFGKRSKWYVIDCADLGAIIEGSYHVGDLRFTTLGRIQNIPEAGFACGKGSASA